MSMLDRLFGGESNKDESCCDMQIEEVDLDENDVEAQDERVDRTED
ncbi:hypothetical protein [Halorubrum kocurii]|nr:hypothetical protein [Halorubrum kocurii]